MTIDQLSEKLTKRILEELSPKIRELIREEIMINENLKRKNLVIQSNNGNAQKKIVQNKPIIKKQQIVQKQKQLVKKKYNTGSSEVDNILNQDILLEDSLYDEYSPVVEEESAFSIAANIRNKNLNNSQVKKSNNTEFNEEQVNFINEYVDRMEEISKDLKKDTTKAYSEFGNVKALYSPKEVDKLKILT